MELMSGRVRSWGFVPDREQRFVKPSWVPARLSLNSEFNTVLPYGNGRSYGDSCLNGEGVLIDTRLLDRFIKFDEETGVLTGEPGLKLTDVLDLVVRKGWFFPVCPGTSYVTLGGALANDVHGKNHHRDGTLGRHVLRIKLLRSDGNSIECSPKENPELFGATIGGLGLTGLITEVSIQLIPIRSSSMTVRFDLFTGLDAFAKLSARRKEQFQYTVAWLDCANSGTKFARGVFISANHSDLALAQDVIKHERGKDLNIPFNFPSKCLNTYSIQAFNNLYYAKHLRLDKRIIKQHYREYFFPLDGLSNWNRIYGGNGFHQYQFVVPLGRMDVMEEVLRYIVDSGLGSFLAVLKEFGSLQSPGILSFPREGWCLALDFSDRGEQTKRLIFRINELVMKGGGAVYPAKDRIMTRETFERSFDRISEFLPHTDKKFSSDFWKRVHG